jgi:hypothetical protein
MLYADEYEMGPNRREFLWDVVQKVDRKFLELLGEKSRGSTKR